MEEYNLINKNRTRTKVLNLFKNVSNFFAFIGAMEISYKFVIRKLIKQLGKGAGEEVLRMQKKNIRNY